MDINKYKKMFTESKKFMTSGQAATYISQLLNCEYPMMTSAGRFNKHGYMKRLAERVVCEELIEKLHNAPPWKDYREIFAELEWPLMRRVAGHSMEDIYEKADGWKRGEADVWFLDLWKAYHDIFCRMPGSIPNNTNWIMYKNLLSQICQKIEKYRRTL